VIVDAIKNSNPKGQNMAKKKKNGGNSKGGGWILVDAIGGPPPKDEGLRSFGIKQGKEALIVTCTKRLYDYSLHYVDYSDLKSYGPYVHCIDPGGSCLLCQVGIPVAKKYLTPVFSVESGDVKILTISQSREPFALLPQWVNVFSNKGSKHLLSIVRDGKFKYYVSLLEFEKVMKVQILPVIKDLWPCSKMGDIDIGSSFPRVSNSTLAEVPEIKSMAVKGITLEADETDED
jgi:hypothetical protein